MRFHLTTVVLLSMLAILMLVLPDIAFAQPGLPDDPDQTPIDGGLAILAVFGGAYAIKKLHDEE